MTLTRRRIAACYLCGRFEEGPRQPYVFAPLDSGEIDLEVLARFTCGHPIRLRWIVSAVEQEGMGLGR